MKKSWLLAGATSPLVYRHCSVSSKTTSAKEKHRPVGGGPEEGHENYQRA